ncbi:MAG: hypothetical protein K0S66_829 [Sphingomonas sp.]|nr:hypothetical protein [Sphingomonas sp.]
MYPAAYPNHVPRQYWRFGGINFALRVGPERPSGIDGQHFSPELLCIFPEYPAWGRESVTTLTALGSPRRLYTALIVEKSWRW